MAQNFGSKQIYPEKYFVINKVHSSIYVRDFDKMSLVINFSIDKWTESMLSITSTTVSEKPYRKSKTRKLYGGRGKCNLSIKVIDGRFCQNHIRSLFIYCMLLFSFLFSFFSVISL